MATPLDSVIEALVIQYLNDMVDELIYNAESAYTAGYSRASNMLGLAVETAAGQKAVQTYLQKYRYKLVQQGLITVSSPVYNQLGDIVRYIDSDIEWMRDKPAVIRNEVVDVIQQGISAGKAAGFRKNADGSYPSDTIAKDIQDLVGNYKSDAATISRTETARCYFNGEKDRYAETGVEYVQWMAADDCCDFCEPYRGKIMPLSECPSVPLHPNCRCDIRPILGSELEAYLRENQ